MAVKTQHNTLSAQHEQIGVSFVIRLSLAIELVGQCSFLCIISLFKFRVYYSGYSRDQAGSRSPSRTLSLPTEGVSYTAEAYSSVSYRGEGAKADRRKVGYLPIPRNYNSTISTPRIFAVLVRGAEFRRSSFERDIEHKMLQGVFVPGDLSVHNIGAANDWL